MKTLNSLSVCLAVGVRSFMLPIQMYCPVSLTFELVNVSPRSGVGFSNQLAFLNSGDNSCYFNFHLTICLILLEMF